MASDTTMLPPWLADAWLSWCGRVAGGRIPHAVLIAGPAGLGKRQFATALATSLMCTARSEAGLACGRCRACTLVAAGSHPDRVQVGLEERDDGNLRTEITIDQVRLLTQRLALTPQMGGLQVVVVDPADAMNVNAGNALLKTLEEPSANTVLVLVADQPNRLPATIRSRCQRIDVRFPTREQAIDWLAAQGLSTPAAEEALALAAGNPGLALSLAAADQRKLMDEVAADLRDLLSGKVHASETATRWFKDGAEQRMLLASLWVRLAAWSRHGGPAPAAAMEFARLTASVDFHKLATWWDRANRVRLQLKTPLRADLMLLELLRDWRGLLPAARRA